MQFVQYNTVKRAELTNTTSESTEDLENKLTLSTYLLNYIVCHKNSMLGSHNGPLTN